MKLEYHLNEVKGCLEEYKTLPTKSLLSRLIGAFDGLLDYQKRSTNSKNYAMHTLYTREDKDAPENIKDYNGDIVLDLCKVCGKGEIELIEPCISSTDIIPSSGCVFNDLGVEKLSDVVDELKRYGINRWCEDLIEPDANGKYVLYSEVIALVADTINELTSFRSSFKEQSSWKERAEAAEAKVKELEAAWLDAEGKISDLEDELKQLTLRTTKLIQACEGEVEEVFAGEIGYELREARAFIKALADEQT